MITCSWTLTVRDTTGKPTALTFDLVSGQSPLIIGMDIRAHCETFNRDAQKYIRMKRPMDVQKRVLFTYLVSSDRRLRLDIAPHPQSVVGTLLGNIQSSHKRTPGIFRRRIHLYIHASEREMKELCRGAGMMTAELGKAIEEVCAACEVCAKNGAPKHSRKVSLTHVNEEFNEELQLDSLFPNIRRARVTVINLTDAGTGYSEFGIAPNRSMAAIITLIETLWICRHGTPKIISADDE